MPTDLLPHIALAAAGVAAGFLNTLAGGGSMLTLPALMLVGLPADVANGTNRLAIVSQSMSGVLGFRKRGRLHTAGIARVLAPTLAGSLAGAAVASRLPPSALKPVLLGTMLAMAAVMALRPAWVAAPSESTPRWAERGVAGYLGLFAAGLYGGFIQAGVGFVLLAVLGGVLRYDVVGANALKLVCTLVFGAAALAVFAAAGQVDWPIAALLAVSAVAGSQLGVRFAVRARHDALRWIILACVAASCIGAFLKD